MKGDNIGYFRWFRFSFKCLECFQACVVTLRARQLKELPTLSGVPCEKELPSKLNSQLVK